MATRVNYANLINSRHGKLVIEGFTRVGYEMKCRTRCDCGNIKEQIWQNVRRGGTKSCGCDETAARITHGMSKTRIYNSWENMWNRCNRGTQQNLLNKQYQKITICKRWAKFENFYADMGERPPGKSIDRIDNNKGYSPENCRWATRKEQQRNLNSNKWLVLNGERRCISDWLKILKAPVGNFYYRLNKGMTPKQALKNMGKL